MALAEGQAGVGAGAFALVKDGWSQEQLRASRAIRRLSEPDRVIFRTSKKKLAILSTGDLDTLRIGELAAERDRESFHADMNMPISDQSGNPVGVLAVRAGREWEHLARARSETATQIEKLKADLRNLDNLDSSIVVFGSLARGEATHSSDIDWTLLIDGKADTQHLAMAQRIKSTISEGKQPGVEGTFGSMAFSHQILHCIGGEDDSNANTTRRILLLLESIPIGNVDAWENVQKSILRRYIDEDRGLRSKTNTRGVPLFLLNDIARYWRIMVVDFAYKQRERANRGYALRSIKLGLSRKLIYISGILACFSCELSYPERQLFQEDHPQRAIEHLRATFRRTPLEIIASILINYEELLEPSRRLFDAYNRFLSILADETPTDRAANQRKHIEMLTLDEMEDDEVFQEARSIRHDFGEALKDIFLKTNSPIQQLMIERGVF